MLVTGILPSPRVYLYTDGSVLLSPPRETPGAGGGHAPRVINTHRTGQSRFLSLLEFRALVDAACGSPEAWDHMWDTVVRQVAALMAMSVNRVLVESKRFPGAPGGFELLGLDVFWDEWLQPWVIEVRRRAA